MKHQPIAKLPYWYVFWFQWCIKKTNSRKSRSGFSLALLWILNPSCYLLILPILSHRFCWVSRRSCPPSNCWCTQSPEWSSWRQTSACFLCLVSTSVTYFFFFLIVCTWQEVITLYFVPIHLGQHLRCFFISFTLKKDSSYPSPSSVPLQVHCIFLPAERPLMPVSSLGGRLLFAREPLAM